MIEFGLFRYDAESRFLYRGDEEIMLPPRVLAVLESLLKRPGKVVTKDAVLESAWDGAFVGEDSLTQAVSQLRSALGDDPQRPTYIQTIPKRGYRFIAEVSEPLRSQGPLPEPKDSHGEKPIRVPQSPPSPAPELTTLAAGTQVGNYELLSQIGAGAMGEVWRARDAELQRDVAIKVVPKNLAGEAAVIERFRREALMLAAVNHPNIATIHAVEEADGVRFIVMELLDGETLQERLEQGALTADEALNVAIQIAQALEVAHDAGIVHRDLKPANIIINPKGHVKVLDFGLAKVAKLGDGSASIDPTLLTESGLLIGTAAYMSPEQAAGKPIDKRSDIFSFGCVLFEMLAGQRLFAGDGISEIVAAILRDEPDWELLPASTPLGARVLLRRCLRKDPDRRLHDIADARIEIEEALADPAPAQFAAAPRTSAAGRSLVLSAGAILIVIAAAIGAMLARALMPEPALRVSRTVVPLEGSARQDFGGMRPFAISPDDRRIVYVAVVDGVHQLWSRDVGEFEAEPIPGTDGGLGPFFSPDGESIGFFTPGRLNTVSLAGGQPVEVCDIDVNPGGGTWSPNGMIVFGVRGPAGLMQVPAVGGSPVPLLVPDPEKGETGFGRPRFLADGESLIFAVENPPPSELRLRTPTGRVRPLVRGTAGVVSTSGHLIYSQSDGGMLSVAFDPELLDTVGRPASILEPVQTDSAGSAYFDISDTGTLVYVPRPSAVRSLEWVSRDGRREEPASESLGSYEVPHISPDGTKIAVVLGPLSGATEIRWMVVARDLWTPLTSGSSNARPVWSRDAETVFFSSSREGSLNYDIYRKRADASSSDPAQVVLSKGGTQIVTDVSLDGRFALFIEGGPRGDIGVLDLVEGGEPEYIVDTTAFEGRPRFSPDGRWIAYESDETGTFEVYVLSFVDRGRPERVSRNGGTEPVWSHDGSALYFRNGPALLAIPVDADGRFDAEPEVLFEIPDSRAIGTNYDVAPDGRFLMIFDESAVGPPTLNIVLNWFEELKERVPPGR